MRTVLVTGASRGIGAATSLRLASGGWQVLAGVRDLADGERLTALHHNIRSVRLDITNGGDIAALASATEPLDALVNNAAVAVLGPVEGVPIEAWRRQFEVNVLGQVAVTQAVLPKLREAGGRIVFVSSSGGRAAVPVEAAYCASKFAIEAIADVLRLELRPWRIGVSVVEPGPTATETWQRLDQDLDEMEVALQPEHRELYAAHLAGLRKVVSSLRPMAMGPDGVARIIERALTASRPRARYLVGVPSKVMVAMKALLPTRLNDAVGARVNGLT